jgi:hypothetical protein
MVSTEKTKSCPKCDGSMDHGFATDHTVAAMHPSGWVEGEPKKTLWVGTTLSERGVLPIVAYRCSSCSFVELYAPAP